jgi:hypothetical protein
MDIDTAFLIADLTEDLNMAPPIGMTVSKVNVLKSYANAHMGSNKVSDTYTSI